MILTLFPQSSTTEETLNDLGITQKTTQADSGQPQDVKAKQERSKKEEIQMNKLLMLFQALSQMEQQEGKK